MTDTRSLVKIYTDGAASPNPGPGGYGTVLLNGEGRLELSGGFRRTTNNRMEIMAAIVGLEALKEPSKVTVISDSQYVVNAMEKGWARRWRARGWMRNEDEVALNSDLWQRLLCVCECHVVRFVWVRGHAGNLENERCDRLAGQYRSPANLPVDEGFIEDLRGGATKRSWVGGRPNRRLSTLRSKETREISREIR